MKELVKKFQDFVEKGVVSGIIIAIISFALIAMISYTQFYEGFEARLYDIRFQMKPSIEEWDALVFIDIDENSINNVQKFPWPRHYYGTGLGVLHEMGVRQAAFDIEFPDKSPKMINFPLLVRLKDKATRGRIHHEELDRIILNNDELLADGIRLMEKVILPFHFQKDILVEQDYDDAYLQELEDARQVFYDKASIIIPENEWDKYKNLVDPERNGIATPIPELINAAHSFGFVDRDTDLDGIERRIRLVRFFEGRLYFQMALVMLTEMCGIKKENIIVEPGEHIILKDAVNPKTHVKGDIIIPIDDKGMIYINWAGKGALEESFTHLPYYALFDYPNVRDEVYDFLDEEEMNSGSRKRSELYGELDQLEKVFYTTSDLAVKRENQIKIKDLRGKIRTIEDGYVKPLKDELKRIEDSLKKEKNPEQEQLAAQYDNYLKAIRLVQDVESLKDKMVISGLTATGTQDLGSIPVSNEYMMVGTYHNVINTIINKGFINKADKAMNFIIMLILAIIMGIVIQRLGARMSLAAIVLSMVVLNIINYIFFAYLNFWFEQLGANLAIFLPSVVIAGMKLMKEESQKKYIKSAFSRYLAPGVINEIMENPEALELGGENREITIFFSDVASFSTISEKLSPPDLVALLNEYLSEMTDIILAHGGTVDKYEGDAIMAFFGAPQSYEDHALRCVYSAIDMKKRLREMQEVWRSQGKDELTVRMGMNSGEAVVGNMGSSMRMDYTAMGDSVNLASRLEGANKYYKTVAMCSGATYKMVEDKVEGRRLDTIRVVGKDEPIEIYELITKKGALPDKMLNLIDKYNKGLEIFQQRDWKGAMEAFNEALKIVGDDGPSLTYVDRCEKYIKRPPAKKWDGVYKLTSK